MSRSPGMDGDRGTSDRSRAGYNAREINMILRPPKILTITWKSKGTLCTEMFEGGEKAGNLSLDSSGGRQIASAPNVRQKSVMPISRRRRPGSAADGMTADREDMHNGREWACTTFCGSLRDNGRTEEIGASPPVGSKSRGRMGRRAALFRRRAQRDAPWNGSNSCVRVSFGLVPTLAISDRCILFTGACDRIRVMRVLRRPTAPPVVAVFSP